MNISNKEIILSAQSDFLKLCGRYVRSFRRYEMRLRDAEYDPDASRVMRAKKVFDKTNCLYYVSDKKLKEVCNEHQPTRS